MERVLVSVAMITMVKCSDGNGNACAVNLLKYEREAGAELVFSFSLSVIALVGASLLHPPMELSIVHGLQRGDVIYRSGQIYKMMMIMPPRMS